MKNDVKKGDFIVFNLYNFGLSLLIIVIIGILLSIIVYVMRFANVEHESWGQIGDFFGGILNPFVSLTLRINA